MASDSSQVKGPLLDHGQQQQPVPHPQNAGESSASHVQTSADMKGSSSGAWGNHNPFDVNSYPITNPPIIDSTFFLPYTNEAGVQRRRRISISNGQIGQIINHEAFYADEDSYEEMNDEPFRYAQSTHDGAQTTRILATSSSQTTPHFVHRPPPQPVKLEEKDHIQAPPQPPGSLPGHPVPLPRQEPAGSFNSLVPTEGSLPGEITPQSAIDDVAGVPPPNHQLLYNNEVIYSADRGPIPGTAAWKKERLLERNRVAASKCRQRKKQAQQELQNNISKYENESRKQKARIKKYEKLFAIYNKTLSEYFSKRGNSIDSLRRFVGKPIDDIDL
ncbi:uncharacterized protein CXQ87_003353 [Candidozyma duobushaemuli]|uniref:BZIP domain-containing protein n=1 Tax=Candidozyma duobushaemuli TaxID=1231522 RepID=A0A2V1AF74_9ASCO|nr:uncharacterized protein CXQ87_003353 [[Candida] duobushaemulonis]PVH15511.1 hypothetical protein CXQ87_003353 [[Candida] duobushaemulonis]